jgi:peptidylprolyl isomerase
MEEKIIFGSKQKAALILVAFVFLMVVILVNTSDKDEKRFDIDTEQPEIPKAEAGNKVKINYIGRFEDGTLFDTTFEDVGRSAGLDRNDYGPIEFVVGTGHVLKGLDKSIEGMFEGEEKNVSITPEMAFGFRDDDLIQSLPLSMYEGSGNLSVGTLVSLSDNIGKVVEIKNDIVTLDFNHPLADRTLLFTIKLESVNKTKHNISSTEAVTLKYFWSEYCEICKIQDPILHEFLQEHPKLEFVMIDINNEENMIDTLRYKVTGTPTFVLKKGYTELIAGGLLSKEHLTEYVCPKLQDEMCLTGESEERRNVTKWW